MTAGEIIQTVLKWCITTNDFCLFVWVRLVLVCSATTSKSLGYIYSNVRALNGATFCVSVTHFKINDVLLYMHFICIILRNFSFSWVIYIILFFYYRRCDRQLVPNSHIIRLGSRQKCSRYTVAAETLADGLNACCPPTLRAETIWMSMLYKFAAAYSVI